MTRWFAIPVLAAAVAAAGCDIVTADLRAEETAPWHKSYTLDASGHVEIHNVNGRIVVEPSAGNTVDVEATRKARNVGGHLEASTTNGGVEAELTRMPDGGVKLECVNGGIEVRLPRDAKATISASIANGGIETSGLDVETGEKSRRHLEARLNGGGARLEASGVNGGIK